MRGEIPYFMTNEEWYYFDDKNCRCMLTDKAPKEAVKSYQNEYKEKTKVIKGEEYVVHI